MRGISTTSSMLALAGALLLAGCNSPQSATDNQASDSVTAADNDAAIDNAAMPAGDDAVTEDESAAPPVQVVQVPVPVAAAPVADTAPLTDAAVVEREIAADTGITRVRQSDGWAWMRDGQIIRTASSDGHRVSYFRDGQTEPYFVQDNGQAYAYSNGRITHQYDGHGHSVIPDAQHRQAAQRLADQAHQQHDRAQQAGRTAPQGGDHGHASGHGQPTPRATPPAPPHATPQPGHDGNARHDGAGDAGDHKAGQPAPAPSGGDHHASGQDGNRHGTTGSPARHAPVDRHDTSSNDGSDANQMAPHH